MILETSVKREGNSVELHTRLVRGRRITDFMGPATFGAAVPIIAQRTVAGLDLRVSPRSVGWYVERAPHHVSHGHVERRPWLSLRDGARWTDKLGFRHFQTGPLLFMLNPRRA